MWQKLTPYKAFHSAAHRFIAVRRSRCFLPERVLKLKPSVIPRYYGFRRPAEHQYFSLDHHVGHVGHVGHRGGSDGSIGGGRQKSLDIFPASADISAPVAELGCGSGAGRLFRLANYRFVLITAINRSISATSL